MKIFPLVVIAGVMALSSCQQTYNCKCTNNTAYEIKKVTKSDAAAECDTHDNICPDSVTCITSWDCGLE